MGSPLVTIGCAVYNGAPTLARALGPVVAQDYPNIEVLISDDCSTDDSRSIIEAFAREHPQIRILHSATNVGIVENFNRLVREARGKYFLWADQDDIRDKTFVRKAVAALEADPEAVLCHSHTGVFMGDPDDVKYIVKMHKVEGVADRVQRYGYFLHYYADTVISGLIRTETLRNTHMFRRDLASGNTLLFELLLAGKFLQIPEVLYFYSARGVRNRPSPREEYERANAGKKMPLFYFPFLVLAKNQTIDIRDSSARLGEKLRLGAVLWGHTAAVGMTKLVYRTLALALGERLPERFAELCDNIVEPKTHLEFLNESDRDEHLFPKYWTLKGGE